MMTLTKHIKSVIFNDLSTLYDSAFMSSVLDKCKFLSLHFKTDMHGQGYSCSDVETEMIA